MMVTSKPASGRHLPFGSTVNARIRPALFPAIQIALRFLQAFEAQTFQRRFLRVAHARLDLVESVWKTMTVLSPFSEADD